MGMTGVIARWRDRLPVTDATPELTLGEGGTPLVRSTRLSERLGVELWFKLEGANPTGSFKDRGMAVAVAKALEEGAQGIVCASTGNTAASAAAYAARAGIPAVVLTPAGAIAPPKVAQARAVGARVLEVRGTFDEALRSCQELAGRGAFALVNSLNPHRIEGQKTAAFEVAEALGRGPDVVALPYGGGGNATAYAKGFAEEGLAPRLVVGEAAERARTIASAISDAWLELASREGLFCEPSSAAGLAALAHVALEPGSTVVCVLTGHGLKDASAVEVLTAATTVVEPTVEAILAEVAR